MLDAWLRVFPEDGCVFHAGPMSCFVVRKIQELRLQRNLHMSLDWFSWENLNLETHGILPSNIGQYKCSSKFSHNPIL
jgi:hypothetical protein